MVGKDHRGACVNRDGNLLLVAQQDPFELDENWFPFRTRFSGRVGAPLATNGQVLTADGTGYADFANNLAGGVSVTDGTHTVNPATELDFTSGATVTDGGGGVAQIAVSGGSGVATVTATDTSIVIAGTATNPTVATGTLDVIAADHPPAANWSNNSHKITALANGSSAQDAAAFGQIPTSASSIGGMLTATYDPAAIAQQVLGTSATQTVTNKRITKRTGTTASSATPTINTDNVDFYSITALATNVTSFTTNLSGTPTDAQTLWIAITDNGTPRSLAWGTSFEASTVALPTTTVASTRMDNGFVWNTATSKWRIVATA